MTQSVDSPREDLQLTRAQAIEKYFDTPVERLPDLRAEIRAKRFRHWKAGLGLLLGGLVLFPVTAAAHLHPMISALAFLVAVAGVLLLEIPWLRASFPQRFGLYAPTRRDLADDIAWERRTRPESSVSPEGRASKLKAFKPTQIRGLVILYSHAITEANAQAVNDAVNAMLPLPLPVIGLIRDEGVDLDDPPLCVGRAYRGMIELGFSPPIDPDRIVHDVVEVPGHEIRGRIFAYVDETGSA